MKNIIIVNGSPRKNFNTAKMFEIFTKRVKKAGGEDEIIKLYDVDFKGCRNCFACKLKVRGGVKALADVHTQMDYPLYRIKFFEWSNQ